MRWRRWWVLAPLVLLAPVPASAEGAAGSRVYSYYAVHAAADGVSSQFVIEGFLPVEEFVGLSSVTSEADLGPLRATSLAALPDPGDLVLTLPGTLSALAGISGLPDYPAAASADHPSVPEDEVVLAPDAGLGFGRLKAEATADRAAATAAVGDLRDTVGLLPSLSIGSIKTAVETVRVRPGVLEATATSTLGDIRLTGGLLRIAEVTSEVHVSAVDGALSADVTDITVSGVELAGTPVGITDEGIVGLGQPVALAPAVDRLRKPLDAAGVQVKTTPGRRAVGDGEVTAEGGSLDIRAPLTVQGYPGSFILRLAPVSVSLQEVTAPDRAEVGADHSSNAVSTPPPTSATSGPVPVSGSRPGSPAGTAAPPARTGPQTELVSVALPAGIPPWDVRHLYGWMAICGAAMLLAGPAATRLGARRRGRSDLRPFWRW